MSYEIATRTHQAITHINKSCKRGNNQNMESYYLDVCKVIKQVADKMNLNGEHLALIKGGHNLKNRYIKTNY